MSGRAFTPLLQSVGGALARGRSLPSGRSGAWEEVAGRSWQSSHGTSPQSRAYGQGMVAVKPRDISDMWTWYMSIPGKLDKAPYVEGKAGASGTARTALAVPLFERRN